MRLTCMILASVALSPFADAGVIYVKKGATGANNGTSWADAFAELRDALPTAQVGDEVWVAAGTYTPHLPGGPRHPAFVSVGASIYGGFSGVETSIADRDWRANKTILSADLNGDDANGWGNNDNTYEVLNCTQGDMIVDGVVITGANANGPLVTYPALRGPGQGYRLRVRNTVFTRNSGWGCFVGATCPTRNDEIVNCIFINNRSHTGAVFSTHCQLLVSNCVFYDNEILPGAPGVSAVADGSDVWNSIIWDCQLPSVGGFLLGSTLPFVSFSTVEFGSAWPGQATSALDPRFEDPGNGDFRLRSSSPCIDAGDVSVLPTAVQVDFLGRPRVEDSPSTPNTGTGPQPIDQGIAEFGPPDCNNSGISDWTEIAQGLLRDINGNWISDSCESLGAALCFGDGTGAACPCGNVGGPSTGCLNSEGGSGRLRAIGRASVSEDSVALVSDGLGVTATALYFQGNGLDLFAGASGLPFGDGLRCVFGTIVRLPIRNSVNGQSAVGPGVPGDQPISVMGAPVMPGTRYYQVWYRDSAPFCTPAFYNMTNAVQITWGP